MTASSLSVQPTYFKGPLLRFTLGTPACAPEVKFQGGLDVPERGMRPLSHERGREDAPFLGLLVQGIGELK